MTNLEFSTMLNAIAEVYKFKSKDNSVTVALMRAARTIMGHSEEIESVYLRGKLGELPGINETSYNLIKEYFESGKIKIYEEIKLEYCEELIKFVRISGLGSRKMFKIYDILAIRNLGDLESKLFDEGFTSGILRRDNIDKDIINEFCIKRLREALHYYKSIKGKLPRGYLENFMRGIKNELEKIKEIKEIKFVGSVRRKKSIVGDIDILVLPDFNIASYDLERSEKLIKKLWALHFVEKIVSRDIRAESISARFETTIGIDVEIIISSSKNWALDLLYTTGSKEHIKKLENTAIKKGYFKDGKIDIGSSYSTKNDLRKELKTGLEEDADTQEEEIYNTLGLQYIPPELREDLGEIELAEKFILPHLVETSDIKGDFHIHSDWSDGIIDISAMVKKAKEYKYDYMAISDHSQSNIYGNGLSEKRVLEKIRYINDLRSRVKEPYILMGAEVDIKGIGRLDYSNDILKKIDMVICAMHSSFPNNSIENTARAVSVLENKYIDILAHPTGVVFGSRAPYFIDMDKLMEAAAKNNKALEINSYFARLDLNEENARKAGKMGVKVAINTDSHRIEDMDMIKLGVDVARRAGLQKGDILNTMSLEEIKGWKKERL
jgi:DNA polymerase (family 10)